jgi:hypothetical protein
MSDPAVPLRDIPEYTFGDEGIAFVASDCNHGSVDSDSEQAWDAEVSVNGILEDHLIPPYALYAETFNALYLEAERESNCPNGYGEAANPIEYEKLRKRTAKIHQKLRRELEALRGSHRYMKRVDNIAIGVYDVNSKNTLPINKKLSKGVRYGWRTEGVTLAPNTVAGVGDLCPWRSPLCTVNCLNMSGHAEIAEFTDPCDNYIVDARKRRTLLFMQLYDVFAARIAKLIQQRREQYERYAIRMNVLSDMAWEEKPFYSPWHDELITMFDAFPDMVFYDYTKNCFRYQRFMDGDFPHNYHLTFSLSEINALYGFYLLERGGSITVVFDTQAERGRGGSEPLPESFCGYPVIDGDLSDLRFEDRERFKGQVARGAGFVVGLRLKGTKHRRRYNKNKAAAAGFIFDKNKNYDASTLIRESERRRALAARARKHRDLPGAGRQKFTGIPDELAREARRVLGV